MCDAYKKIAEAHKLMAEAYDELAEVGAKEPRDSAVQEKEPEKEAKPVKKAEKKKESVPDTPKGKKQVDLKTVRAFLTEKSRKGKTSEVKNLIEQVGYEKLSDIPDEKLPELYEKAQVL